MKGTFVLATLLFSFSGFAIADSCKQDDCLNSLKDHSSAASAFCTTYLAKTVTATTGIPTFISRYREETPRLSSACSCLLNVKPKTTSTSHSSSSTSSSHSTSHSGTSTSSISSTTSSQKTSPTKTSTSSTSSSSSSQLSCTSTVTITSIPSPTTCPTLGSPSTITLPASTVTTTIQSNTSCPTLGPPSTITSVSTFTTTTTVTSSILPTCYPHIIGGDFTSTSQNLAEFTVTENPPSSIFTEVLASSAQGVLLVNDGTLQFLLLNYVLVPIPTSYTLSQNIGTTCAPYTSLTLSATINAQFAGGVLTFCINPSTCATAQNVPATNGDFVSFSATFPIAPGTTIIASLNLNAAGFSPIYVAGIGKFEVTPF